MCDLESTRVRADDGIDDSRIFLMDRFNKSNYTSAAPLLTLPLKMYGGENVVLPIDWQSDLQAVQHAADLTSIRGEYESLLYLSLGFSFYNALFIEDLGISRFSRCHL